MFYGYRMSDDGWVRMKTFKTIEEYQDYVIKKKVVWGLCTSQELDLKGKAAITYDPNRSHSNTKPREGK